MPSFSSFSSVTLPTPGKRPTRQWQQKCTHLLWLNHEESIRLPPVRSEFGQKFVWRHASRRCQTQFLADLLTNCACNTRSGWQAGLILGNVEIRFVQRQRLHQIRVPLEDLAREARDSSIPCEIWGDEDCVGA